MKNHSANQLIQTCDTELNNISNYISKNKTNILVQYLIKYATIKACGTIEASLKVIIGDFVEISSSQHIKNYINITVRSKTLNPKYPQIVELLNKFEKCWADNLKNKITPKIISENDSLVTNRNNFAHGDTNTTPSIQDIKNYYNSAKTLLKALEGVLK